MAVYKRGRVWWYRFTWRGDAIRESTKQSNQRMARQMEAAHRASLAKGEFGFRDRIQVPTLKDFAERDFMPFIQSRFVDKPKTLEYYRNGFKNLLCFAPLASCTVDTISAEKIAGFVTKRRDAGLQVSSINRELAVLRRMLKLAVEWNKVERILPRIAMLPGERHRDRVLSSTEEDAYLQAAAVIGGNILEDYRRALEGIRATMRGQQPIEPWDPYLLRDVATVLSDCGLRPEECFRLRWEDVRDDAVNILFGKTKNARRTIPLTPRASALLEMRRAGARSKEWVFPSETNGSHIAKSTLKRQHPKACKLAKVDLFPLYTLRHTCLTRWAAYMDPYTLAYLAGHSDFSMTRRYVHPQAHTVREAMERARNAQSRHSSGHNDGKSADGEKIGIGVFQ